MALDLVRTEADLLRQQGNTAEPTAALLTTRPLAARVLGERARGLLASLAILDVGASHGLTAGALVLGEAQLDVGDDSGLAPGHLVLLGREVWGQIVSVDRWTSAARHMTQPGYRDLVQLAHPSGDRFRQGPHGVLEGTGDPLCRLRMVAVTEPVCVGDVVLTDGGGTLSEPLCYGAVVRVEQPRGAAHWEIWVQPASKPSGLGGTVAVLRTDVNPTRIGAVPSSTTR
jgi:cell shape-determining protein MreC